MRVRWQWIVILLGLTGLSAYFLRDLVRYYLLTPLVYLARIEQVIQNAIPQGVYWIVFLIFVFLFLIFSLPFPRKRSRADYKKPEIWKSRAWQFSQWLKATHKSDYSKWMLSRQMSELALDLLVLQERLSTADVVTAIRSGVINMPAMARDYFLTGLEVPSFRHYSELMDYWKQNNLPSPLDINPDLIIDYLEHRIDLGGLE